MRIMRTFKFAILPILLLIMNLSIRKGVFPTLWKTAKVIPLYKSGNKKDVNNYRPISLLPIFGKVLEKHVCNTLSDYLTENNILSKFQFGFRKSHSTCDALLSIKKHITFDLNRNLKVIMISIDLKKAFDLINHQILLSKLKAYGCDKKSIKWFSSYLRDRHSFVISKRKLSKLMKKSISVPQGGCLSAILFVLFINDIFKLPLTGKLYLFADDMTLIVSAKSYSELESNCNSDLKLIYNWLTKNRLIPNFDKSNFMLMGRPLNSTNIDLNFGQNKLKRVFESKRWELCLIIT